MKYLNQINVYLLLLIYFKTTLCESEWVDPFNVDFVTENRLRDTKEDSNDISGACSAPSSDAMLYYKRTINLLLSSVALDEMSGYYKGKLVINLPIDDFEVLKEFSNGEVNEPLMLQKINEILTNTIEMTFVDRIELAFISWTEIFYGILKSQTTWFVLIILSTLFVVYRLLNAKFSTKEIIFYVVLLGYVFDFSITWKRLLQELEINQYADSLQYKNVPADCFPKSMTGWQVFTSYFKSTTDCRQYYKNMMYDFMWDVGPLDVIAHQSRVLVQIFGNVGTAISQMVSGLMSNFPFPLNLIMIIPLLIFTLAILCIICTYCTNTQININLMHLIQLHLKKTPTTPITYREEIQEVTQSEIIPQIKSENVQIKSKKEILNTEKVRSKENVVNGEEKAICTVEESYEGATILE